MALNAEYIARETFLNLRRNVLMTVASVLTVAVTLVLVGTTLLMRQAVGNATQQWKGGIEFAVWLQPDASEAEAEAVAAELTSSPLVDEVQFVSQQEAFEEFKDLFRGSPDMVAAVNPEVLPPSYRVVPADPDDTEGIDALGQRFHGRPGIYEVTFAKDAADAIISRTGVIQGVVLVAALGLTFSATVLILNTIALAIHARRREIEVMKLVGATNWFIRVPLMLEGMVQGMAGAVVASGGVWALRNWVSSLVENNDFWGQFSVSDGGLTLTVVMVLAMGAGIGTLGSAIAVRRSLNV
ncbi:MAG TPA: permease-like cell division protein FtsX [Acidimicrobiales bacterium]